MVSYVVTLLWVGGIYALERPKLKKSNQVTHWCCICLLAASAVLWQLLMINGQIPRPAEWLDKLLGPLVP